MLFGLAPSPFLLVGVTEQHLSSWKEKYPDIVAELRKSLYVDDLVTVGQTIAQAADRKTFKCNSNASELELNGDMTVVNEKETYKQQLGGDLSKTTMLQLEHSNRFWLFNR